MSNALKDNIEWYCRATINKYDADIDQYEDKDHFFQDNEPYEVSKAEKNLALNEGVEALIELMGGISAVTAWDNANANIGVGNSATAADDTQTGLQGASTAFAGMDTGYPQRTNQTITFQSVFGGSEANFAWEEFTVVNAGADTGDNLNRLVSSQGTKASGQTWTIAFDLDF